MENTLKDYLDLPLSEFKEVLNKRVENAFGTDIVPIKDASQGDQGLYKHISVAVTKELLPVLNVGTVRVNGVTIPIPKKMVSKALIEKWKNGTDKMLLFREWETLLSENNIEIIEDVGKRPYNV